MYEMKKEKHVCPDNLDKPEWQKNKLCSVLPNKAKISTLRLVYCSGRKDKSQSLYTILRIRHQPGKPNAAQLTWDWGGITPVAGMWESKPAAPCEKGDPTPPLRQAGLGSRGLSAERWGYPS